MTIQQNIGDHLLGLISVYQHSMGWDKDLKSLGSEAVLSLYKSKRRLRWYDQIPSLHKAFSMMAVLPPDVLAECDSRFLPVVQYLEKNKKTFLTADMAETIYAYINPRYEARYEAKDDPLWT